MQGARICQAAFELSYRRRFVAFVRPSETLPEQLDAGRKGISMSDGIGILESGAMRYFPGRKGGVDLRETPSDKSEDRE